MTFSHEIEDFEDEFPETFGINNTEKQFNIKSWQLNSIHVAFTTLFRDSVYIGTRRVSSYNDKGFIKIPKKFRDHPVTVVIWPKGQFSFSREHVKKYVEDYEEYNDDENA